MSPRSSSSPRAWSQALAATPGRSHEARTKSCTACAVEVHRAGDIEHACADLTRLTSVGAPRPAHSTAQAVHDFVRASWHRPGVAASAWDEALGELEERGLTS